MKRGNKQAVKVPSTIMHIRVPDNLRMAVQRIAVKNLLPTSSMMKVLIAEALAARKVNL